jgi:hypothetical protein
MIHELEPVLGSYFAHIIIYGLNSEIISNVNI